MSSDIRILIVDDEHAITNMLATAALEQLGWKPTEVQSATAAAELMANESFDVYVIDKNLPDGNGVELVRRVRENSSTAVCVIITAYPSSESARETMRLEVDAYVEKPFDDITGLADQLRVLLEQSQRRDAHAEPRTADRPLKVLVASPDQEARTWLEERFRGYGDEIATCEVSREVGARVREHGPDLIILDAALSDPDALTVTTWVDARAIVILTRSAPATREIIRYISLDVKAVLERPLKSEQFADEMDGLLWRLRTRRQ